MNLKYCATLLLIVTLGQYSAFSQISWNPRPVAGFTLVWDGKSDCDNKVKFRDTSKIIDPCNIAGDSCDTIIQWKWDFGDGNISIAKNPINDYTHSYWGEYSYYTINLKVRTKYGLTDSTSITIYIAGPMPKFKVKSDTIIEVGDTVLFENITLDPIDKPVWVWHFGDSHSESDTYRRVMQHQYQSTGKFNVYLGLFDNVNGTSIRCYRSYPDSAGFNKKKITITVISATIISILNANRLTIYPNPANDHFIAQGLLNSEMVIYDILGKEIIRKELIDSESIDISTLNNGAYFIRCNLGSKKYHGRFIKNCRP